jgi:hypothetical protein
MVKQAAETYATGPEKDVLVLNAKLYGLWQVEEQGAWFLKCQSPVSCSCRTCC